jgi:rhodanese-related sulfurtransferase
MSPRALYGLMQRGERVHLLDVRESADGSAGPLAGAVTVPGGVSDRERLAVALASARAGVDEPVYVIGRDSAQAEAAARRLRAQGLDNLTLIDGGIAAWRAAGLPIAAPGPRWSLERQARVAVGALVVLLLVKGVLLHPVFHAGLGLLGVALILSGLAARPGLGALLMARLPWNRRAAAT